MTVRKLLAVEAVLGGLHPAAPRLRAVPADEARSDRRRALSISERRPSTSQEARRALGDRSFVSSDQCVQIDDGVGRWWTFAGGRVNHTLKYGFEILGGWKVVADNFQLRIEGEGVTHGTVEAAIVKLGSPEWWKAPTPVLESCPGSPNTA